jgi:uncharacterized protein YyaL (SSP411 family)
MNRLAREQSPYLLQHAQNPVDWYPWGDEAFDRARREDKPIFLSIGYSTCHWCHVMEHESFESPVIADLLNRDFVSIKVDREERPDVDRIYMAFVQATTGAGGWPMSVWLTPALQPFYGGTYYPPESQWGRPGFREVLGEIARAWREERAQVVASAAQITARLADMAQPERDTATGTMPGLDALANTVQQFKSSFDRRRGGFGDAPKFPRPSELLFLLREFARNNDGEALDMVLLTLRSMALGGMRDHIGGGFHRYSVDGNWRVPHFEKMLYDQAQLVLAYLEAAQASGDPFFAQIAEDTLLYVRREMTDDAGGFYSAEDADSVPPEATQQPSRKTEGAFYVWPVAEVRDLLGDDSAAFEMRYGLLPDGNAPFDPHNEFTGKNLLYTARGIADIAKELGREPQQIASTLMQARVTLFDARAKRPRPHLDDKVLTGWNGLMIAAFARAARTLPAIDMRAGGARPSADQHLETARKAATFLRTTMWDEERGVLLRRYRKGESAIAGYAEDYAFLIFGVLELFFADGEPEWLAWAIVLQRAQDRLFWDERDGGWFSTTGDDPSVLVRMKEEYDGAEPSASGVGVFNLLTLAHLTGDQAYEARARRVFETFNHRLTSLGRALPFMASALSMAYASSEQIVVVGAPDAPNADALWRAAQVKYRPFAAIIRVASTEARDRLGALMPWVASMTAREGEAAAYVCRNFACEAPTTDPDTLRR